MDVAKSQKVTEDAYEAAPPDAGPVGEIQAQIATAFAPGPAAASRYGEVSNRFVDAAERHAEAMALSQQADREEIALLRQALSELCEGTAAISAHTAQHFAAVFGAMADSDDRLAALADGQAAQASELETVHAKLKNIGAVLKLFGKLIEAAGDKASRMDASLLALQEHTQSAAARQNDIQAAMDRLEKTLAGLDQRLENLSGAEGPIEALRGRQSELTGQQHAQGRAIELVQKHIEVARDRDTAFEQRIIAVEERIAASIARLEAICNWQARLGQALTAEPGG